MKNYYEILKIPINATTEQIKKSYRKLAKKYHPDLNKDDNKAVEKFNLITEAYNVLSDRTLRLKYNEELFKIRVESKEEKKVLKKAKVKIIYSRSLGVLAKRGFFLSTIPKHIRKRQDIKYDIEVFIDYYDAQKGCIVDIDVPTKLICPTCTGNDPYCFFCDGKGYIIRATKIQVVIPKSPISGEIFEVDLSKIKQKNLAVFRVQKLRMKVVITATRTGFKCLPTSKL